MKYETRKIEGLELLYHLVKNAKMTYKQAVNEMIKHNQDMSFLDEYGLNTNNINLNNKGGSDVK
tara:strand:- start:695 stop:886 length:192 start_codon:yes stop_codon:yes gene_type:complete